MTVHIAASSRPDQVAQVHRALRQRVDTGRRIAGRPLTLTEKLLLGHLAEPVSGGTLPERGEDYVRLLPDGLAMPDSSAQMALLQFMTARRDEVALPVTVHCDHLVEAEHGSGPDLRTAFDRQAEVYDFLRQACARYGLGFWEAGSGIIHQVLLENYVFPGGLQVGTDSHTQNAGGLGMLAAGVGGAEAVDVMLGLGWTVRWPRVIGVRLTGSLHGWASPKDVVLALAGVLGVNGATGAVLEYSGPGTASLSTTGKATICNMGTELGATSSLFGYDDAAGEYLCSTGRPGIAELADENADLLTADDGAESGADRLVELDLDRLEPQVAGPHRPDVVRPVSRLAAEAAEQGYPVELSNALIGSCTNSSYADLGRAADLARQARAAGLTVKVPLLVTPGSGRSLATLERDGLLDDLTAIGATVLASACGPCIGQWRRTDAQAGKPNAIITSFNRNFPRRNDGSAQTLAFLASPSTVVAAALAGRLDFDPVSGTLDGGVRLAPPRAAELPATGWEPAGGFVAPPADRAAVTVTVHPDSERLHLLEPFTAPAPIDYVSMPVLLKATGACTTDHISPAGPWLRLRGHLDNLSDNLFLGAVNAFADTPGRGVDQLDDTEKPLPEIARHYRSAGLAWVAVGDENYGEGSSREHAAMSPRHLGCLVVLVRSFARIHEANLKKQGILPLTFADPAGYDLVRAGDRLDVPDVAAIEPGRPVSVRLRHDDGSTDTLVADHTLSTAQLGWIRHGSALNALAEEEAG